MPIDQPPAIIEVVDIEYDPGGNFGEYLAKFRNYRDSGTRVHLTGVCLSACTLVTILPEDRICITAHTRLAFHHVTYPSGPPIDFATRHLMDQYPEWVREWIARQPGGVLGPRLMVMGPMELAKHYRICVEQTVARQ